MLLFIRVMRQKQKKFKFSTDTVIFYIYSHSWALKYLFQNIPQSTKTKSNSLNICFWFAQVSHAKRKGSQLYLYQINVATFQGLYSVNKSMPLDYQAIKVGNSFSASSNMLFIDVKRIKCMNPYCTKYFSQAVSFKPSSYSSLDKNANGEKDER